MGRFYRTTRPPQLDYSYKLPYSLAANVIHNIDTGVRQDLQTLANMQMQMDTMMAKSSKNGSTFGGQVLPNNQGYYSQRMQELDDKINEVTNKIKSDPVNHQKYFGDILNLRKEITHELTVGPIGQMRNQYTSFQKQMDEDIKRNKKVPASYIRGLYMLSALNTPGYDKDKGLAPFTPPDVSYVEPHELAMKLGKDMRFNNAISSRQYVDRLSDAMMQDNELLTTLANTAILSGKTLPELLNMKKKNPSKEELASAIKEYVKPYAQAAAKVYWRDNSSAATQFNKKQDIAITVPGTSNYGTVKLSGTDNPNNTSQYMKTIPGYGIIDYAQKKDTQQAHYRRSMFNVNGSHTFQTKDGSRIEPDESSFINGSIDEQLADKKIPDTEKNYLAASYTASTTYPKIVYDNSTLLRKVDSTLNKLDPNDADKISKDIKSKLSSPEIYWTTNPKTISTDSKQSNIAKKLTGHEKKLVEEKLVAGGNTTFMYKDNEGNVHYTTVKDAIKSGVLAPVAKQVQISKIPANIKDELQTTKNINTIYLNTPPLKRTQNGGAVGTLGDDNSDVIKSVFGKNIPKDINSKESLNKLSDLIGYNVTKVEKSKKGYTIHYEVSPEQISGKGFQTGKTFSIANIFGLGDIKKGIEFTFTGNDKTQHTGIIVDNDVESFARQLYPRNSIDDEATNMLINFENTYGVYNRSEQFKEKSSNNQELQNLLSQSKTVIKKIGNNELYIVPTISGNGITLYEKTDNDTTTYSDKDTQKEILKKYLQYNKIK